MKIYKVFVLLLLSSLFPLLFVQPGYAQWVPIGRDEKGQTWYVSSRYWDLENKPWIRIFYNRSPYMTQSEYKRGRLIAVDCRSGALTYKVSGDGKRFKISDRDYDWVIHGEDSVGYFMAIEVCNY
jgi:hypothetical protein